MATRFVHLPSDVKPYSRAIPVDFQWENGMSVAQKTRSSNNLRMMARINGVSPKTLECSRASKEALGEKLSAFNLDCYLLPGVKIESFYQGIKVMRNKSTGDLVYLDNLITSTPLEAKKEPLLRDPEFILHGYRFTGSEDIYKAEDSINIYSYIYIKSILADCSQEDISEIASYSAFTDIMLKWRGGKLAACQAHSIAMMIGLSQAGVLGKSLTNLDTFIKTVGIKTTK